MNKVFFSILLTAAVGCSTWKQTPFINSENYGPLRRGMLRVQAAMGSTTAMNKLEGYYLSAPHRNEAIGLKWAVKAATLGVEIEMNNAGVLYLTRSNYPAALFWLYRAKTSKDEDVSESSRDLINQIHDALTNSNGNIITPN